MNKSLGTLKEVGHSKAAKKKGIEAAEQEENEFYEPLSRERSSTSFNKTYIQQDNYFLFRRILEKLMLSLKLNAILQWNTIPKSNTIYSMKTLNNLNLNIKHQPLKMTPE